MKKYDEQSKGESITHIPAGTLKFTICDEPKYKAASILIIYGTFMNSEVRITTTGLEKEKDKRSMLQAGDWFDFKIVVYEETRYLYELLFYSGLPCL